MKRIVIIAIIFLAAQQSLAGPPFLTDDPEPVEKGHGELYLAAYDFWTHDGANGTLPHVEFNYGPIENLQLHIIAPATFDAPHDGPFEYGYGDTELGAKYRFIQEDSLFKGCPQVGTFPLIEVPTGDSDRGLGNGKAQYFLPIWLQKSFGEEKREWTVYGGGGYWVNPGSGNKDYNFAGVVLQKQLTDNLTLGGEIFHTSPSAVGESDHTNITLGGIYDFSDNWHFLFSVGRDIHGDTLLNTYFAIQLTF